MLFRQDDGGVLAISQPAHAWISGQLLRAWDVALPEPLLLAAEQHDIAWMDWEVEPSFDAEAGRPHLFRDVGAALHAPMWRRGVERALEAWGAHVALLVSRHGGVIYRRFTSRHRLGEADAAAAANYLETQAPREAAWAAALGFDAEALDRQSQWIACVDALSLLLCGELQAPRELDAFDARGKPVRFTVAEDPSRSFAFQMSPWPFRSAELRIEGEGRRLPEGGRFPNEAAFQAWQGAAQRAPFHASLAPALGG